MSPKTTGLLALCALALGAFVFFYEIEGSVTRQAAIDEANLVHTGLEAEDVDSVSLTTLDGVDVRFERDGGVWTLVAPFQARADATNLDAIVHALVNMPREGSVESGGALDGFGLGSGATIVRFEVDGSLLGLRVGRSTPVGGHRYVARLSDDAVAYVESYRINAFNRNLDDLRDRRIFQFEAGDVDTLRISWPKGPEDSLLEVGLSRDDQGEWQLDAPMMDRADQEVVRELLSNLAYLRAEGFVEGADERLRVRATAALDTPAIRFDWTLAGAPVEGGAGISAEFDGVRAIAAPDGTIYTITVERLDDFPRSIDAYRFKQMASFEVSSARRLDMEFVDEGSGDESPLRVVADLEEAGWTSATSPIDDDRVSELVQELAGLKAAEILAEEMGPDERASVGLNPPRAHIRVEGEESSGEPRPLLAELRVGRLDPTRGLFAQRGDAETIFVLPASSTDFLPVSAEDYRAEFVRDPAAEDGSQDLEEPMSSDPMEGLEFP